MCKPGEAAYFPVIRFTRSLSLFGKMAEKITFGASSVSKTKRREKLFFLPLAKYCGPL